jgi:hypothetical protein
MATMSRLGGTLASSSSGVPVPFSNDPSSARSQVGPRGRLDVPVGQKATALEIGSLDLSGGSLVGVLVVAVSPTAKASMSDE